MTRLLFILVLMSTTTAVGADLTSSWIPNTDEGITGYTIHHGSAAGVYTESIPCGLPKVSADGRMYFDARKLPDGKQYYSITAERGEDVSPYSNEIIADPTPGSPDGLSAVREGTTVVFTWEKRPESDLRGYVIRVNGGAIDAGLPSTDSSGNKNYTAVDMPTGEISATVSAVDLGGNESAPSVAVVIPAVEAQPPLPPADFKITGTMKLDTVNHTATINLSY